jgi:transposase
MRKQAEGGHARTMGTERCPVGTDRTDLATETTLRRSRPALAGHASCAQRSIVDLGYGGAMARAAQEISFVPNLPSPLSAMGAAGQAGTGLARAGRGVARPRKTGTGGGFHRRLLHGGKKGGLAVGPTKRGKGTKIIALADDHSLPLAVSIESASPHESQLVEGVLGHSFLDNLPMRLIGDKAYDSDRLDRDLAQRYGIEMIAPHRGERREPTQDGRPLRRYRRRWRVERLFAWLHHFRRLVIRWEYHVENFFGMVHLGCMKILFRSL